MVRELVEGLECDGSLESVPRSIHPHLNPLPSRERRKGAKAHFRTNRSSQLPPAHQDMKTLSCGFMRRIRTGDFAVPRPGPSGGQAPALHYSLPARNEHEFEEVSWPAIFVTIAHPSLRRHARVKKAGVVAYSATGHGEFCLAPPRPQRGTSPRTTLALGRVLPISRLTSCRAGFVRGFPPPRE